MGGFGMKKLVFFICFSIVLFVGVVNKEAYASTFSNPEWQVELDNDPLISQFNIVKKNGYLYIYNNLDFEIIIIDDKSGKQINKIKTNNDVRWMVTEKGIYTINHSSSAVKLNMYNKTGAKVWDYNFKENADFNVNVKSKNNGDILVYLQHKNKYHFSIYLFNSNGKVVKKEEIDGFIHSSSNGYLVTSLSAGNNVFKLSVYDDNLNFKFSFLNDLLKYGSYVGMTKDGVLYFKNYDTDKNTIIYARNTMGKLLWTKTLNEDGRDSFFEGHSITGQAFNNSYLINSGNSLYLFNSKGLVAKKTFKGFTENDHIERFQFGEDRTIMTKDQNKLIITNMEDLGDVLEIHIDNKYLTYLYAGNGIIYTYDNDNTPTTLNKFDINKK